MTTSQRWCCAAHSRAVIAFLLAACLLAAPARAEDGVSQNRILFGQSAALSGPAAALGLGMRRGLRAAFDEQNAKGGVHGRKLELVTLDDRYEPEAAVENTQRLLFERRVFALIGAVGTPTSKAVIPLADQADAPYVGAFTGAELLRDPYRPEIVNIRASYFQETEALTEYLMKGLDKKRIAIFYQNDSFGRAGRAGVVRALERRGETLASEGRYVRNSDAVKLGVLDVMKGRPDAVIMVGAYDPLAKFVQWSAKMGFKPTFASISFIGSAAFASALAARPLADRGEGVIVSQVVPFPEDMRLPVARDYRNAIAGQGLKPDFVSFEGYIVGRFAIEMLEQLGENVTREAFLAAVQASTEVDVGGLVLGFGKDDSQGSDAVFLTELDGAGGLRPLGGGAP